MTVGASAAGDPAHADQGVGGAAFRVEQPKGT
jgi:hypothetical protein